MTLKLTAAIAVFGIMPLCALSGNAAEAQEMLTREMAIARVIAAAPALDAQRENIKASQASIQQAEVKPNPSLTTDLENFTGTGPYRDLGSSEFTFAYNQRFERGGKRQYRIQAAEKDKQIAIAQWHINRLDIALETERLYIAALVAQAKLDNAIEQTKIFASIFDVLKERMERGKSSNLAVQNARVQLLRSQNKLGQSERELDIAKRSLSSLWHQPDAIFTIDARALFILPQSLKAPNLGAIEGGPDISLWKRRQEHSASAVALERANAIQDPTFKVGLRYMQGTRDVAAVAGASIPFALYDTNSGNINRAKAHLKKSQYDLLVAERRIERHIFLLQNKRAAAFVQANQILNDLVPQAETTKALVLTRLQQGAASYLDVFSAQALAAEFQEQLTAELEEYQLAQAEINRLTASYVSDNILTDNHTATDKMIQDGEGK